MSLNDYIVKLRTALRESKPFSEFNKDISHAIVVICSALYFAKGRVLLLSNKLDPLLYATPAFDHAVNRFLERDNARLDVLVEKPGEVDQQHPIRQLADQHPEKVEVKAVPANLVEKYEFNFMVVDDIGYRFERNRGSHGAVVSFNEDDPERVEMRARLVKIFDFLKEGAEPLR